jgi:DHA1 family bicyclomycin/chloramphenicol resistance-like MFS transporter
MSPPSESAVALAPAVAPGSTGLLVPIVLSLLLGFASISTDLYLPALPTMAGALHADAGAVELTIAGYLVGFSVGQLLWGPIGDRYGRRGPVAVGLVLFVVGAAGCALSDSVWQMIGWRLVQAVGACAGVVLARAMVRDLYARERAAQMLSTLMTVMAVAPLIGPILGGQILVLAGWRAIFWVLVGVGVLTLGALFALPETLPPARRNTESLARAFGGYGALLRQRTVMGYAGAGGFLYGGIFAYVAGTPFAYITYYRVSPQWYGALFATGVVGIMGANLINARLVARVGGDRLLRWATLAAALAGVALATTAWTGWGGLAGLVVPLFAFVATTGFIVANAVVGALATSARRAGAVSALIGATQYGAGVIGAALVGVFADATPWPLGWVVAVGGLGAAASAWFLLPSTQRAT